MSSDDNDLVGVRFFKFDTNSLSNNIISCDALDLQYQLSTPTDGIKLNRTVSISRQRPSGDGYKHIADWERKQLGKDQFRWSSDQFQHLDEIFPRTISFWGGPISFDRKFLINGKEYVWKSRSTSLELFCGDQPEGSYPIASFHRQKLLFGRHKPYIKVADIYEDIFDYIIVTCIISEKNKRDGEMTVATTAAAA